MVLIDLQRDKKALVPNIGSFLGGAPTFLSMSLFLSCAPYLNCTLRCLLNRESKNKGAVEIFVKFNKQGGQNKQGVGISEYPLLSVINKIRDINV